MLVAYMYSLKPDQRIAEAHYKTVDTVLPLQILDRADLPWDKLLQSYRDSNL